MKTTLSPTTDISAVDAKYEAQKISFAPVAFQCARVLRDTGILHVVANAKAEGATVQEIQQKTDISEYGIKVLLDMGVSLKLVSYLDDRFVLMKTGYFILHDEMTR